jgi:RecG-like helicase
VGAFSRFLGRFRESDEDRLATEIAEWAGQIPDTLRIAEITLRKRVKVAGIVRRITVRPVEGFEALEVVLWDGTGDVTARWLGRRSIPGLSLGSRLVVEGVVGQEQHELRMVNPTFEFVR